MFDIAIKNGTIIEEDDIYEVNVYIKGEKVVAITSRGEELEAETVLDASGKMVFPGAIDAHMHIGEYGADFEDMRTSTQAAVSGGVTTCMDMPLNLYSPSIVNAELFNEKKKLLASEAYTDFGIWGALVPQNIDRLNQLHEAGAVAFKCFLTGGGNDFYAPNLGEVREALRKISNFGGMAGFHCEDYGIIAYEKEKVIKNKIDGRQAFLDSRPVVSEIIATQNVIALAKETGAKIHICHVSHPSVAKLIEAAKDEGVDITAETTVHHLTFTEEDYLSKGCLFGCAPPLRNKEAQEKLWKYVRKGVIDFVVSDHSPGMPQNRDDLHQPTYKSGYGISSIQTMFMTFFDQAVNKRGYEPTIVAKKLAANPARRFGIYGRKGAIKIGFDADLVIFNPNKEWTIDASKLYYKQKTTAFHGLSGKGSIETVFLRGNKVVCESEILGNKGLGSYISGLK